MITDAAAPITFEAAVPQFSVPDVARTAEYYRDVLGFEIAGYWNGQSAGLETEPPPVFGIVCRDRVQLFFNRANGSETRTGRAEGAYDMYFRVAGVDALAAELHGRGADITDGRPKTRSRATRVRRPGLQRPDPCVRRRHEPAHRLISQAS